MSDGKIIKRIQYENWWDFTNTIQKNTNSLFRGHANFNLDKNGQEVKGEWKIISNFNRTFPNAEFSLEKYSYDQFWNYSHLYKDGNLLLGHASVDTFLSRLQFFQHYGIPTPLIDFTKDPITALYFALAGVHHHGVKEGGGDRYITIMEINIKVLNENFGIKIIKDQVVNFDTIYNYYFGSNYGKKIGFIIPEPQTFTNKNLIKQEGAFLYYDSDFPLENLLEEFFINGDFISDNIPITFHNIPYESFREKYSIVDMPNIFCFLMNKGKIGMNLFDDLQGVKYDYYIPNLLACLKCLNKEECKCLLTLKERNVNI